MTTDEQVIAERLDLEMLERPHLWPQVRLGTRCVFVKKRGAIGFREFTGPCFLTTDAAVPYVVMSHDWGDPHAEVTVLHYSDAQAVYDDGWRVD